MSWNEIPLLKPTLAFIGGITMLNIWSPNIWIPLSLILTSFIFTLILSFQKAKISTVLSMSILNLVLFFLVGWFVGLSTLTINQKHHYSHQINEENRLLIKVTEDSKIGNSVKTFGEVLQVNKQQTRGQILIYFQQDSTSIKYRAGDVIALKGKVQEVRRNGNPNAFNYKAYLSHLRIHNQIYVKRGNHRLISQNQLDFPVNHAIKIRRWGLERLRKILPDDDEFAVASALILGERKNISDELYATYSETGAIHVLAVSGLHVGIITYMFFYLLNLIKSKKTIVKILKISILLSIVWAYALITGGAPAVMRASLMFSLILIGRFWFDNVNIYNILCASALILLAIDPLMLFQVSFQFSYMALISIVFFYSMLYKHVATSWKLPNKLLNLSMVSVAAQILVLPLTIFYFHKVPTYFVLSGVFAVFLAPFVLGLGLASILFSSIPYLSDVLGIMLSGTLQIFIKGIDLIHKFPMSSIKDLWIHPYQVGIVYIGLIALMFFLHKKRMVAAAFTMLTCCICFLGSNIYHNYKNQLVTKITVYDTTKKKSYFEIYQNQISTEHATDRVTEKDIGFMAINHRMRYGIKTFTPHIHKNGLFNIKEKIFYNPADNKSLKIPKHSDYLLLIDEYDKPPQYTLKYHSTDFVVLDKSIPYFIHKKWIEYCKQNDIPYHSIQEKRAFELEL